MMHGGENINKYGGNKKLAACRPGWLWAWPAGWLLAWLAGWVAEWLGLGGWVAGWLAGWLPGCLLARLPGRPAGWLMARWL